MADWETISALATGGGTLVLAVATFQSVRSANHAARVAEQAMLAGWRPLLTQSRLDDPPVRVSWADGHWVTIEPGYAEVDVGEGAVYLAFAVRSAGAGIAVIQGWLLQVGGPGETRDISDLKVEDFVEQTRDLYISPGDTGFWQGALRDAGHRLFAVSDEVIRERRPFAIDLLYGDYEGGQRMISRFQLSPKDNGRWSVISSRHRNVDRTDPRGR